MFYSRDVILSRKGKLSVVWLLGGGGTGAGGGNPRPDKRWGKRSDALKLDLHAVCDEIASRLPVEHREHFSLR